MKRNKFKDAKLGDPFRTCEGKKAIFKKIENGIAWLMLRHCEFGVGLDGKFDDECESGLDIVSPWFDTPEELDKIINDLKQELADMEIKEQIRIPSYRMFDNITKDSINESDMIKRENKMTTVPCGSSQVEKKGE